ncbi:Peptidoglycan-binding lysin domain protein [Solidesulfovibrio fructosivorans JJ]]|uniref:Peptidoglycan-binding lysin domain protein n=1 Tax=Solidesulfovibrio fructosivorans JJ] TaxID=596151 RepID=E1JY84_SOLFR|nr:LysM peptidoglycan-binding domain-containing protein [Solidesulfovibrio fructosivorans]EFL50658.1 Peptidoglycan-binding lysin domain protein [Solidesulfovibrio fructosivorans JJ]]
MQHHMKSFAVAAAAICGLLGVFAVSGCGKYDSLERNAQYVSDDLARENARAAYESVVKTHERWVSSGGGKAADDQVYGAYKDAYEQYAILYNELLDRQGKSFSGHLFMVSDELPPPPPGMPAQAPKPKAPAPKPVSAAPVSHELDDASRAAAPPAGIPMAPAVPAVKAKPAAASDNPFAPISGQGRASAKTQSSGADSYVIASGDTLRKIAKRFGISEKSLMEANGITDPDKIAAGKTLTIPKH